MSKSEVKKVGYFGFVATFYQANPHALAAQLPFQMKGVIRKFTFFFS